MKMGSVFVLYGDTTVHFYYIKDVDIVHNNDKSELCNIEKMTAFRPQYLTFITIKLII